MANLRSEKRRSLFAAFAAGSYFLVLLLALASLGTFASRNNTVQQLPIYNNDSHDRHCLLFADHFPNKSEPPRIELARRAACDFVIWGQAVVAVYAMVEIILQIAKIVTTLRCQQKCRPSYLLSLDLGEVVVGGLIFGMLFWVGLVVTSGLALTCDALDYQNRPCTSRVVPDPEEPGPHETFAAETIVAVIATWLSWFLLGVILVVSFVTTVYEYCARRKEASKEDTEIFREEFGSENQLQEKENKE